MNGGSLRRALDDPWGAESARARKIKWLENISSAQEILHLTGYEPLMQLLDQLVRLLLEPDLDHTRMLRVFEGALDDQGWPEKDPLPLGSL